MSYLKIFQRYWCVFFIFIFFLSSCEKSLLQEEYKNDPKGNYESFWNEFDKFYGAFEAKNINWDSLRIVYGSEINSNTTNQQLYEDLCGLLSSLNDGHASLYATNIGSFRSWSRRNKKYFYDQSNLNYRVFEDWINLIKNKYLGLTNKEINKSGYIFYYGSINYFNSKIGYVYIPTFNKDFFPDEFISKAAEYLKNTDGVIIDLRYNGGGSTETFLKTLDLFASEHKLFIKSKFRNGPKHNDFSKFFDHYTNDNRNNGFYNKPIAILVNSFTSSSSEHFLLGMKTQNKVFSVGDTTCGAFSLVQERVMPNGWVFRFGAQVIYTPDGKLYTDKCGRYLEGIGIAPDYYVPDSYSAIISGKDLPIEFALKKLISGLQ